MYRKIYRGDFKWPLWFSSEARRLVTKPIDPNPSTRITISKVMDSSWFKKSIPKVVLTKQEQELDEPSDKITAKQTETLNVFHIISLSEGMNGSGRGPGFGDIPESCVACVFIYLTFPQSKPWPVPASRSLMRHHLNGSDSSHSFNTEEQQQWHDHQRQQQRLQQQQPGGLPPFHKPLPPPRASSTDHL
ncbi:hypothetical protein ACFX16_033935 [Malus domestica]